VSVQLINANNDEHIWAEDYDSSAAIPPKTFRDSIEKILELLFPTAVVWY
jgi:TolB-like protein